MRRATKQFTISMPSELAEQVTTIAKIESRTISELFREAFRNYRSDRIRTILTESQQTGKRSGHMGYKPGDVERLIHETREKG
jgi:metal-responsive CopG/Arc/MetJ family transcriptional regulator